MGPSTMTRLTPTECKLLSFLVRRAGELATTHELTQEVWGTGTRDTDRRLVSAVHRLRAKIELDPKEPRHLFTIYGTGYRFALVDQTPLARPSDITAHNLPGRPGSLVGRDEALSALVNALSSSSVVVLHGPGGVGKSTLAAAYAWRHRAAWATGGIWWCDLTHAVNRQEVLSVVAAAVGAGPGLTEPDPASSISLSLATMGTGLVVLDAVERVSADVVALLDQWRALAPDMRWLVTSRQLLPLLDVQRVPVAPLDLPAAEELLQTRAQQVVPGWGDTHPEQLRRLTHWLDGLPLALELAAAQAALLDPPSLLARLEAGIPLVGREPTSRHYSVRATIEWSAHLLSADERSTLLQCAVFAGEFTLEGAEAVVRLPEDGSVADALVGLWNKSMVLSGSSGGSTRLKLLVEVRQWALAELPNPTAVRLRAAKHYAHLGDQVLYGDRDVALEQELAHLRAGFEAALAGDATDVAARLAWAEVQVLMTRGPSERFRQLLDALGDRWSGLGPDARCRVAMAASFFPETSRLAWLEQAVEGADRSSAYRVGAQVWLAKTLAFQKVRPQDGRAMMEEAVEAARGLEQPQILAWALDARGRMALDHGEVDVALASLREATQLEQEHGAAVAPEYTRAHLAAAMSRVGQIDAACELVQECRASLRKSWLRHQQAHLAGLHAYLEEQRGNHKAALAAMNDMVHLLARMGLRARLATARADRAAVLLNAGQLLQAETAYIEALPEVDRWGSPTYQALVRMNLAIAKLHRGRLNGVADQLEDARARFRALDAKELAEMATGNLGIVAWQEGRWADAEAALSEVGAPGRPTFSGFYFGLCRVGVFAAKGEADAATASLKAIREAADGGMLDALKGPLWVAGLATDVAGAPNPEARGRRLQELRNASDLDSLANVLRRVCLKTLS